MSRSIPWPLLEEIIRRDPGGRGLSQYRLTAADGTSTWLGDGELQRAAESLATGATAVAIVTGFCIVGATPPAAETDGPPGAFYLATAFARSGVRVAIVSDAFGMPLLAAGLAARPIAGVELLEMPFDGDSLDDPARWSFAPEDCRRSDAWIRDFFASGFGSRLSHLLAIERVGPSHTPATARSPRFAAEVPLDEHDRCHNMRGRDITGYTAKTHRLFEHVAAERLPVATIGIADGGNELGAGRFPWDTLTQAIAKGPAATIACRVATEHTILAGISNWGGYALALAFLALRGDGAVDDDLSAETEERVLAAMIAAGAVDGVTLERRIAVDGVEAADYLATLRKLQAALRPAR